MGPSVVMVFFCARISFCVVPVCDCAALSIVRPSDGMIYGERCNYTRYKHEQQPTNRFR